MLFFHLVFKLIKCAMKEGRGKESRYGEGDGEEGEAERGVWADILWYWRW